LLPGEIFAHIFGIRASTLHQLQDGFNSIPVGSEDVSINGRNVTSGATARQDRVDPPDSPCSQFDWAANCNRLSAFIPSSKNPVNPNADNESSQNQDPILLKSKSSSHSERSTLKWRLSGFFELPISIPAQAFSFSCQNGLR
jgi:hypothetical protein